ncbi:thiol peroxidase [Burkholderia sp. Nafp2/4-1b]|uniref:thiol peroxidase n=1 Tax=Burkholderia sp. Nafp2/4-1b TaxID=2116686 RepID=UPI000EF8F20B|nr:thiol peroxidase [Burkholderia sp. Nafp2/4-1b]RKT98844.1 thiol peroxidase [Burkholderia sp. Nafp2/4-1b]
MSDTVTLNGKLVTVAGPIPEVGKIAPDFELVNGEMNDVSLADFHTRYKIINIFPSVDTPVCGAALRRFNEMASKLNNTVVVSVSADIPFAQRRFCAAENIDNVVTLSNFRSPSFGKAYGVAMTDGPLKGLNARAVVVLNPQNKVIYSERMQDVTKEPDYESILTLLQTQR